MIIPSPKTFTEPHHGLSWTTFRDNAGTIILSNPNVHRNVPVGLGKRLGASLPRMINLLNPNPMNENLGDVVDTAQRPLLAIDLFPNQTRQKNASAMTWCYSRATRHPRARNTVGIATKLSSPTSVSSENLPSASRRAHRSIPTTSNGILESSQPVPLRLPPLHSPDVVPANYLHTVSCKQWLL